MIKQESDFRDQTSHAGARGLMQITPDTADTIETLSGGETFVYEDLANPELNIRYGTFYLRHLLDRFGGNEVAALAAYNGGPENAEAWGGGELEFEDIPFPETTGVRRERPRPSRAVPGKLRRRARALTAGSLLEAWVVTPALLLALATGCLGLGVRAIGGRLRPGSAGAGVGLAALALLGRALAPIAAELIAAGLVIAALAGLVAGRDRPPDARSGAVAVGGTAFVLFAAPSSFRARRRSPATSSSTTPRPGSP